MSEAPENNQAEDMVTITVDGQEMQAPKGAMLIEVTDAKNIRVPRFCYHKKLAVAANCRMCLVDVEKMPKPAPACATPVMEGMKVTTQNGRHGRTYPVADCQRCTEISDGIFADQPSAGLSDL